MTLSVTHAFVSAIADDPTAAAAGEVVPSNWNAAHVLSGGTQGSVLFVGAGGVLAQDNANFNWNDSTGALNIQNILNFTNSSSEFSINVGGSNILFYGPAAEPVIGVAAVVSSVDLAIQNANGATAFSLDNTTGKDFAFFSTGTGNAYGAGAFGQYNYSDGRAILVYTFGTHAQLAMDISAAIGWGTDQFASPAFTDTLLWRDAAGVIAQRADNNSQTSSTNAQTFRVYNTYTNSTNYERGIFDWQGTSNVLTIGTEKGSGGGSARNLQFVVGGTNVLDYGVTDTTPGWTFTTPASVTVTSANPSSTNITVDNTFFGGKSFSFFSTGNSNGSGPGLYGQFNNTDVRTVLLYSFNAGVATLGMDVAAVLAWGSNQFGTAVDTGVSRSAAGIIAFGNGTAGDASATILAKTKAGAPTTSDVPAGTWVLIRDTTNSTTKMYYNNAGTLQSVALV